jgi:hypothetical protein
VKEYRWIVIQCRTIWKTRKKNVKKQDKNNRLVCNITVTQIRIEKTKKEDTKNKNKVFNLYYMYNGRDVDGRDVRPP